MFMLNNNYEFFSRRISSELHGNYVSHKFANISLKDIAVNYLLGSPNKI